MTVVLVHGLTASTDWWRPTIAALAPQHDVRLVELPGVPLRDAARRLLDWFESEGVARASVVGHSMGGTVALLAAVERPAAVDRLVLVAPAGIFVSRRRRSYMLPLARSTLARLPTHFPLMIRDALRIGPLTLWRVASDLLVEDIGANLREVRAPTLVIWGERDHLLPPELGRSFCDEIPNCRLVTLPKCGHVPMLECPAALHQQLLGFLE